MKKRWADGCYDGVFLSPTSIEVDVSDALDLLGIPHKSQFRPKGYTRIFDEFVYPNILIELQGDYWHSLPHTRRRDAEKATWAIQQGYCFLEFWECDIRNIGAEHLIDRYIIPFL